MWRPQTSTPFRVRSAAEQRETNSFENDDKDDCVVRRMRGVRIRRPGEQPPAAGRHWRALRLALGFPAFAAMRGPLEFAQECGVATSLGVAVIAR